MFQALTQGSTVSVLYKNIPKVVDGRVVSVNTHMPVYNPQQPLSMMNGPVTDITVQVADETIPFAGLPANGIVANFPEKNLFLSTDKTAVSREVDMVVDSIRQDLKAVPDKQRMLQGYEALALELNPEKRKDAEQARELAILRSEMADLKEFIRVSLGTKPKEDQ